jgi:hypothetical protein
MTAKAKAKAKAKEKVVRLQPGYYQDLLGAKRRLEESVVLNTRLAAELFGVSEELGRVDLARKHYQTQCEAYKRTAEAFANHKERDAETIAKLTDLLHANAHPVKL